MRKRPVIHAISAAQDCHRIQTGGQDITVGPQARRAAFTGPTPGAQTAMFADNLNQPRGRGEHSVDNRAAQCSNG
jgi:hypothetical protein